VADVQQPTDQQNWIVPEHTVTEFGAKQKDYCVCIPVINEGDRIAKQLQTMSWLGIAKVADIIIADGGSTDDSLPPDGLAGCGVRALLIKTGPGRLSAQLRMAYAYALKQGYKGIITIDGNDKDGPDAIPRFVAELEAGQDLVQGSRFRPGGKAENTPLSRLMAIRLVHAPLISLASGVLYTDTTNGYRGYSSKLLLDPRVSPFRNVFESYELLPYLNIRAARLGYKIKEIPVARCYPKGAVPTKISSLHAKVGLLEILLAAITGRYDPT
jgi:dolichol-phosphate mannosyltransferase